MCRIGPASKDGLAFKPLDRRTEEPSRKGLLLPLTVIASARIRRHARAIDILDINHGFP
jgi:hypothetical protein